MLSRAPAAALVLGTLVGALVGCETADGPAEQVDDGAFCRAFTTVSTAGRPAELPSRWMAGVDAAGLPAGAPPEMQRGLDVMADLYENGGMPSSEMTHADRLAMDSFQEYAVKE